MKLRNIFTMLMAAFTLTFVGCQEPERFLEEVKVSKSYVAIPVAGGDVKVDVDAVADWTITAWDLSESKEIEMPSWLTVTPLSGAKGKTEVVFSAEATTETHEVVLHLNCGDVHQVINVMQMASKPEAALSTCDFVLTSGVIDQFYRIKGVVAEIPLEDFQKYGKFFITDETTDKNVQIYGLANKSSYLDNNTPTIAVGDVVTIEGSWSKYGNFNNDTQILSVEKNLIKVEKVSPAELSADGDVFTVTLTNKGEGLEIVIPEADAAWLSAGEPLVLGTTYVVELTAAANESTPRSTTVTFSTTSGGKTYQTTAEINQDGGVPQKTIAEAIASDDLGMVIGKVLYVHSKGVLITDGTDVLYGYVGSQPEVAVGDVVSMIGKVTIYNGGRSMNKPTVAKVDGTVPAYSAPSPVTLDAAKFAELTDKSADFATPYVTITGVAEVDSYNNIIVKLVDGETTYSVKSYYHPESFADFKDMQVTVTGYAYNAYNDSKQVNLLVTSVKDAAAVVKTLTNAEILAALTSTETSYVDYTIESASGQWTVNASQLNTNTFLQCRGKKGSYIKTPAFDKDIKSVTIHFTSSKSVYADNVYCVFPATWTAPTADAAYTEEGNVGKATTDGTYSLTIPVEAGNKQVCISIIGTYSYYLDHIDVEF